MKRLKLNAVVTQAEQSRHQQIDARVVVVGGADGEQAGDEHHGGGERALREHHRRAAHFSPRRLLANSR